MLLLLVLSMLVIGGCGEEEAPGGSGSGLAGAADTAYVNGRIYTVNESQPWVEAVAIRDGAFIAVGSSDEVRALIGDATKVVDLKGGFAMPGLHDVHIHCESFYTSAMLDGKMLTFSDEQKDIKDLQAALVAYAKANPSLPVLFAEQLPLAHFPNLSPTKAFIDEVLPDRPVVMLSNSEHEALLNAKALAMEGITSATPTPEGGEIVKDARTGEPTGLLKESAAGRWGWSHYPGLTEEQHLSGMRALLEYLQSIGVTSIKQQHAKTPVATAFKSLEDAGELGMRVGLSWTFRGPLEPMPMDEQEELLRSRGRFASDQIGVDYVKLSIDGTAGATGYVLEPYVGSDNRGISFYALDALVNDIARFDAMGIGVSAHASGDAAVRLMIDAIEAVKKKQGSLKARHQVCHAHFMAEEDLARVGPLDITIELSPVMWFATEMTRALGVPIGPARMKHAFRMQSIAKAGGRFVMASDGPLFWQEPLGSIEAAVTRQAPGGGKALAPTEAISLAQAIRAMTIDAAYVMNHEDRVGTIETGKRADLIVLSKNPFDGLPTEIHECKVLRTVFDGRVVYDATSDLTGEKAIEEHFGVELDLTGESGHGCCEWHLPHMDDGK